MADFLDSLLKDIQGGGDQGTQPPQQSADQPATPTNVEGVDVVVHHPQPKVNPINPNYDNSAAVQQVNQVTQKYPQHDDKAGIWGLLPHSIRTGTLRNVLGALGDAFLVGHGDSAQYRPRQERERMGDAMIGQSQDYGAAADRVAATGVPDSASVSGKIIQQGNEDALKRQVQEQTNQYHQDNTEYRKQAIIERMQPTIGAWAQDPGIRTPMDYQKVWDRATTAAKRVDPNLDASSFGYVDPKDWQPGANSTAGATTNGLMRNATSRASIDERATAAGVRDVTTRRGQDMMAGRGRQPTTASMISGLITQAQKNIPFTARQQQFWDSYINGHKPVRTSLLTTPASDEVSDAYTKGKGHAKPLTPPTTATNSNAPNSQWGGPQGGHPVPARSDIQFLKSHPEMKSRFEAQFGPGSASQYVR